MTIITQLSTDYTVKSTAELADEFNRIEAATEIVDGMSSDSYQDLVGRTCYEFSQLSSDLDEDNFKEWASTMEEQFKDALEMVYAIDGDRKYHRINGKISGVAVNASQRKVTINGTEYQIKHEPMPGAYRSAKSVIQKAIKHNIQLLDIEGMPKSKNVIEAELKDLKSNKTPLEKFTGALDLAMKLADQLEGQDVHTAHALVADLELKLLQSLSSETTEAA